MTFDHFVGQVQHRARLSSLGAAVRAIQATLPAFAARLTAEETKDLASQLPREIAFYLQVSEHSVPLKLHDFFQLVSAQEQTHLPDAVYHARVVLEVLKEAVSEGEVSDIKAQLPEDWRALIDSGSQGHLHLPELTAH
ncbi:DUF2267 domain-containing protein [Pedosphaera parvula]|uniref:DUF2267 domain-containing protein n=1 Tax=Pedosphaera parvula (strain Ellin514) TaxID=320771 RepID=B9XP47_PEDPL|nr:DUF2267 domain-containing protein [Pedosphaera parvula]EEF58403.1 conserved hypothetical protein [Pedosphaera parvula Ellin514]